MCSALVSSPCFPTLLLAAPSHVHPCLCPISPPTLTPQDRFVERAVGMLTEAKCSAEIRRVWVGYWSQVRAPRVSPMVTGKTMIKVQ